MVRRAYPQLGESTNSQPEYHPSAAICRSPLRRSLESDDIRLCGLLQVDFHAFLRTSEMLQVRAAHFVGDPVTGSRILVLSRTNHASHIKT